jgi:hypothetical protein
MSTMRISGTRPGLARRVRHGLLILVAEAEHLHLMMPLLDLGHLSGQIFDVNPRNTINVRGIFIGEQYRAIEFRHL